VSADAFKKVKGNDPLVIPAGAYNAFIDAAMDLANRRLNATRGNPGRGGAVGVLISNQTGGDLDAFSVVGLGTPIFQPNVEDAEVTETFKQQAGFNGVIPADPTHVGKFAVLREPIPSGAIGQAMIAGVTAARVNFTDADHGYAEVADGVSAYLASGATGSAKVLWKEAGTGTLWAIVLLGVGGPPAIAIFPAKITASAGAGSYTGTQQEWSGTAWADKGGASPITIRNLAETTNGCTSAVPTGTIVPVSENGGAYWFDHPTNALYKA